MDKANKTECKSIDSFVPGTIFELVKRSYARFTDQFPDEKERLYAQWLQEDQNAFDNQATIGRCVALTCSSGLPVGYYSWDDRHFPTGIIGQNCVLPEFRYQGIGSWQIETIINLFREKNFSEIRVTTGDHEFFLAARNMYKKLGFAEHQRTKGKLFGLIEFRKELG
jgi:GNAT superfamily N-acetyltransferase